MSNFSNEDLDNYAEELANNPISSFPLEDEDLELTEGTPVKKHYKRKKLPKKASKQDISEITGGKVLMVAGVVEELDHKDSPFESVRKRTLYKNGNGWNYHWMNSVQKDYYGNEK